MEYLNPQLSRADAQKHSTLALAHVGDGVYELMVRTYLASRHDYTNEAMHRHTLEYVSANAQAAFFERVRDRLTDEELEIFRRGRNAHTKAPKHTPAAVYHTSTGLEALFGFLWLVGERSRLEEIFLLMTETENGEE